MTELDKIKELIVTLINENAEKFFKIMSKLNLIVTLSVYILMIPTFFYYREHYPEQGHLWVLPTMVMVASAFVWFFGKVWAPFVDARLNESERARSFLGAFLKIRVLTMVGPLVIFISHVLFLAFFISTLK